MSYFLIVSLPQMFLLLKPAPKLRATQFDCHNVTSWTFAELSVNDGYIRFEKDMKFEGNDKRKIVGRCSCLPRTKKKADTWVGLYKL
ncbi:MAG: hypothetical protein CVT49_15825 [candidate division Zixibacteria bacterium HGW-Zixibacteria-1]|nr:MAG: hypothetical protein CVT49_15825 [candidate division Zixibacteria bacterium HGW-Zixibacteria-1]